MKLIIKDDMFDLNKIIFKNNKNGLKLTYKINDLFMIGIPLKVKYNKIFIKDSIIYVNISKDNMKVIEKIDNYFNNKIDNYISFIHDNKFLKVKKHIDFNLKKNNELLLTINSIKEYKDNNYVHIFTI